MKQTVHVGIVGSGSDKFTPTTKDMARRLIAGILTAYVSQNYKVVAVSGHSPVGGIDIWAEDIADTMYSQTNGQVGKLIFPPKVRSWEKGYKLRNLEIANHSNIVHVIVVDKYPESYAGTRFKLCYHCKTDEHIKSGACWTAKKAIEFGNEAQWHILKN